MQDKLFDVIILGASTEGIALAEYIKSKAPKTKVALVSKHFNFVKPKNKLADTELITGESIFSNFNHGLIILTLKDRRLVVGKNLVLATGGTPIKSTADKFKNNKNICYHPREITINPKNKPAVVYGDGQDAVDFALSMAKKFKYVYLCSSVFKLECDSRSRKKLENTANIVHLPNCLIVACKNNKDGKLAEITLNTYAEINCNALVLALGRTPCTGGIDLNMIVVDKVKKYYIVNSNYQSTIVNNIYAIGECIKHSTRRSIATVGNKIIGGN